MRLYVLYAVIAALSIYAWKDWFVGLCGLIVLMAGMSHPDMPRAMFGIVGFNPWNLLFGAILLGWAVNRCRERPRWDAPRVVATLLLLYLGVIIVGVLRAALDPGHYPEYPLRALINDQLVNTVKWILPGVLLFDGCRTRRRAVIALSCLLVMYVLFAVQAVRAVPVTAVISSLPVMDEARRRFSKDVGYSAPDLSVMLAGAFWGALATLSLVRRGWYRLLVLGGAGILFLGQAVTGGRGGYVAWGVVGLVLCLVKWRRYLVLAPIVVVILPVVFPGVAARLLKGFGQTDVTGQATIDREAATAGRFLIWPYVVDKIGKSPLVGYGRLAMMRTGLFAAIEAEYPGTGAPHPHNMYLETLFDNGILGSIPIFLFFGAIVRYSASLFRSGNRLYSAVGGLSLALTLTSLLGGMTGQHVYPQEHTLGIWAAMFLTLRVYVEEKRVQTMMLSPNAMGEMPLVMPEQQVAGEVNYRYGHR
jgi:O-antigen ligase